MATTVEANDGSSGLTRFKDNPEGIDLILTDVNMPRMSGPEMVQAILATHPQTRILFISGTEGGPADWKRHQSATQTFHHTATHLARPPMLGILAFGLLLSVGRPALLLRGGNSFPRCCAHLAVLAWRTDFSV